MMDLETGLQVREIGRQGWREFAVTSAAVPPSDLRPLAARLHQTLAAEVLAAEHFGPSPSSGVPPVGNDLPLTCVLDGPPAPGLGGLHLSAVAGARIRPLRLAGQLVGAVMEGPYAVECMLSGLYPPDPIAPPADQARAVFARIEQALALAGMDFGHVARTWFFLDDILAWYDDFNRVRAAFLADRPAGGLIPASTGVGGSNPLGAALVARAYAVRPLRAGVNVQSVPSPLQCPAAEYGSYFSRAVEVVMPDLRRLLISGTASIAPDGRTRYVGDVDAQVAWTCEVVSALLRSRGMGWGDVTRATAYFRRFQDCPALEHYRLAHDLPDLPLLLVPQTICRDDLLFELEVDAVCSLGSPPFSRSSGQH